MHPAEIFETDATIETPAGTFKKPLTVTESSPLEAGAESYKRYARKSTLAIGYGGTTGTDFYIGRLRARALRRHITDRFGFHP